LPSRSPRGGYEAVVLDNLERPSPLLLARLREVGLPLLVGDVRSFHGCRGYDVVVHAAAYIDVAESAEKPVEYLENNAVATARVAKACAESGALLIYMSSAAVCGEPESLPLREDHPTRPISPYGLSKLVGEQVLQAFREDLRPQVRGAQALQRVQARPVLHVRRRRVEVRREGCEGPAPNHLRRRSPDQGLRPRQGRGQGCPPLRGAGREQRVLQRSHGEAHHDP